jgi:exosortase D (VPLPA-CTERM-specific)
MKFINLLSVLKEIKPVSWLRFSVYGVAIIAVYNSALKRLIFHDWAMEDYSHCDLIPFVVLYFLWEKRRELTSLPSIQSWIGIILFCLGIVLFWLGELAGEYFTIYMSLWLVIVGLCWLHLGWVKIKVIWFALFIMLAMFPFPGFVSYRLSLYLKIISSQVGVWMLQLYGMTAYREGNVIDLGFTQLQVVDACSGLRYLFPLMVLSLILAYWFRGYFWKRIVLFLSSIPIAIFVNSFRIALTGAMHSIWGPAVAEGFFHGFSGWLIFMFTTGILVVEMWILKKAPPQDQAMRDRLEISINGKAADELRENIGDKKFLQPQFVVAVVLLVLTMGLSQGVEFREKIPIKQPLNQFPLQVGKWIGMPESMDYKFLKELRFTDYVIVNYKDPFSSTVNFYMAYFESQRKGESIHSPETCLPGGGWEYKEAGVISVPIPGGGSMQVNRAFIEKSGSQQLIYYWFSQRGRNLTNLYQLKIYGFWDALTKQRTDGAMIRVVTPVDKSERLEDAEARLQGFIMAIVPIVEAYIPGK